jgi:hypothetical protein
MEEKMKLSAPKVVTWLISLALTVAGVLGFLNVIPAIGTGAAFWLVCAASVLLLLASLLKGL